MPGFSGVADLQAEIAAGKTLFAELLKNTSSGTSGQWQSLWKSAGWPAAGADPATTPGTAYSGPVTGGITFNDTSTDKKYISKIHAHATAQCNLMIYDRLVGVSGISTATTGDKTVNSTALTRYTSGDGVVAMVEFTTTGAASMIFSASSYTNDQNVAGQVGGTISMSGRNASTIMFLPLAAGDTGFKSIETFNVNTSGGSGVVNIVLMKPIITIPLGGDWALDRVLFEGLDFPEVKDGAVLAGAVYYGGSAPSVRARFDVVYG